MAAIQIFLSTVSAEFETYREALERHLTARGRTVSIQEHFAASGTPTFDKLDGYVQISDVVVHLLGDLAGAMAHRGSRTQRVPSFAIFLCLETRQRAADNPKRATPPMYMPLGLLTALLKLALLIAAPREHVSILTWIIEQYCVQLRTHAVFMIDLLTRSYTVRSAPPSEVFMWN